jgi:hypothetical protein
VLLGGLQRRHGEVVGRVEAAQAELQQKAMEVACFKVGRPARHARHAARSLLAALTQSA